MAVTPEVRFAIEDLINLHGHLVDRGVLAGLSVKGPLRESKSRKGPFTAQPSPSRSA